MRTDHLGYGNFDAVGPIYGRLFVQLPWPTAKGSALISKDFAYALRVYAPQWDRRYIRAGSDTEHFPSRIVQKQDVSVDWSRRI
jgi:hypothetical protein